MKRIIKWILITAVIVAMFFVALLIYLDKSEWTVRTQVYNTTTPITTSNDSLCEIEKQVRQVVEKRYSNVCLVDVQWQTNSRDGFDSLEDGSLDFTYQKNIGDFYGYYNYDRYIQIHTKVDLSSKAITKIEIAGDYSFHEKAEITIIPEFDEIRSQVHECITTSGIQKTFVIKHCNFNISNNRTAIVRCTIILPNGVEKAFHKEFKVRTGQLRTSD